MEVYLIERQIIWSNQMVDPFPKTQPLVYSALILTMCGWTLNSSSSYLKDPRATWGNNEITPNFP